MAGIAKRGGKDRLGPETVEAVATRLVALADPRRIELLEVLRQGEASVQGLADALGLPHQNVSHHLRVLDRAGLLSRRREGSAALYRIEDWGAWWVVEQVALSISDPDD